MDWEELSVHVAKFERTVAPIPGDGYCMIEAMRYCLQEDFGGEIGKEKFRENIKDELYEGIAGYAQGHVGGIRKFLKDVEAYFANAIENYTTDVVDIILGAAANTIKSHVGIFQNIGGKAVVIFQHCNKTPTERTIYLKFDYYPENPGRNHYSSIVLDKNPKSRNCNKKSTWAEVASKKTPCTYVNSKKQMEMSLLHQYGENYESVQWDMEDEALANDFEDVYVPMLPNQLHTQENQSLISMNNMSKNSADKHIV